MDPTRPEAVAFPARRRLAMPEHEWRSVDAIMAMLAIPLLSLALTAMQIIAGPDLAVPDGFLLLLPLVAAAAGTTAYGLLRVRERRDIVAWSWISAAACLGFLLMIGFAFLLALAVAMGDATSWKGD